MDYIPFFYLPGQSFASASPLARLLPLPTVKTDDALASFGGSWAFPQRKRTFSPRLGRPPEILCHGGVVLVRHPRPHSL